MDKASIQMTEVVGDQVQGVWVRRARSAPDERGAHVGAGTAACNGMQAAKPDAQRVCQTKRPSETADGVVERSGSDCPAHIAGRTENIGPSNSANRLQR